MNYFFLFLIFFSLSQAEASQLRIYCRENGISFEHRLDEKYTRDNVTLPNVPWFVVDEANVPAHEYAEQLKCSGNSLIVDHTIKPEWAIKKETLESNQVALDAELEKSQPDVIEVARLQRSIEKLKRGK